VFVVVVAVQSMPVTVVHIVDVITVLNHVMATARTMLVLCDGVIRFVPSLAVHDVSSSSWMLRA
jgi:hypothetical protein